MRRLGRMAAATALLLTFSFSQQVFAAPVSVNAFGFRNASGSPIPLAPNSASAMVLTQSRFDTVNGGIGTQPTGLLNSASNTTIDFSAVTAAGGGPVNINAPSNTFSVTEGAETFTFRFLPAGTPTTTGPIPFGTNINAAANNVAGAINGFVELLSGPGSPSTFDFGDIGQVYTFNFGFSASGNPPVSLLLTNGGFQFAPGNSQNVNFSGTANLSRIDGRSTVFETPVPEPATFATFAVMGLLGVAARRKMKKAAA